MPTSRCVRLCLALVVASAGNGAVANANIDPPLLSIFSEIYGRSERADHQRETAAFLSRDANGEYRCTLWQSHFSWRAEAFSGVTPPATFALVHTHPKGLERPSQHDVAECMRTGYTFYVITFWQIYRIEPATGSIVSVIWNQDWTRDFRVKTKMSNVCQEQSAGH